MGCFNDHCFASDHCIKDVVRKIVDAQVRAAEEAATACTTSCEQSIEDLLSPTRPRRRTRFTTIPIMLICKDSCKPFVGSGFVSRDRDGERSGHFECIESPIFKVRGFVRDSDSCVRLELLLPVGRRSGEHDHIAGAEDKHDGGHDHHVRGSFCDQFGRRRIENFRETGLCITVDLDFFAGITCLDPITPVPR